jgi:hypothetical protein
MINLPLYTNLSIYFLKGLNKSRINKFGLVICASYRDGEQSSRPRSLRRLIGIDVARVSDWKVVARGLYEIDFYVRCPVNWEKIECYPFKSEICHIHAHHMHIYPRDGALLTYDN